MLTAEMQRGVLALSLGLDVAKVSSMAAGSAVAASLAGSRSAPIWPCAVLLLEDQLVPLLRLLRQRLANMLATLLLTGLVRFTSELT